MTTTNKRFTAMLAAAAALLLLPLIAMQFTKEVNWSFFDFLIGGILLFGTVTLLELALRRVKKRSARMAICAGILIIAFLIWAELAVGIFGSPWAGS